MKPALLLLAILGCAPDEAPPPPAGPESAPGTVLLVDGLPLSALDVAPLCADILALYPEYAPVHARRLALTNEFLPRLAARARDPEGWQRARTDCEEAELETLVPRSSEGTFHGLGVALWSAARHLPEGQWSPPVELAGRWLRLRLDERVEERDPREERLCVSVLEFPFLGSDGDPLALESAVDQARLTIIDPDFGEAVPELWKHRMLGKQP